MKTLIQKDLRENLKVAWIGLLIFSLLLLSAYLTNQSNLSGLLEGRDFAREAHSLQPLLDNSLLNETAFFCALFGLAIGWLQTRNEAHRDLWAYLIHRPMTRTKIFWSKVLAGLGLYAFGAGVPLAILVAVVSTPGHVAAPFEWAMGLPLVAIFLAGVAGYFAGLLTGLRQARWFASRGLGIGLGILAMILAVELSAGRAFFWIAIIAVIQALAAWGSYQTGGVYRGQPWWGKLATAVTMAVGSFGVMFIGLGLLVNLVLRPLDQHSFAYSFYRILNDGTIYQETVRDGRVVQDVDLAGHSVLDRPGGQKLDRAALQRQTVRGVVVSTWLNFEQQNHNTTHNGDFFILRNVSDMTLWYLDRHGRVLGYDGHTRQFIGRLEAGGPNSESFRPSAYYSDNNNNAPLEFIASTKILYQVDYKSRTVKPLFSLTNADEIGGYSQCSETADDHLKNILLTTRQTIQLLRPDGQSIFSVPYQPGYLKYPRVGLYALEAQNGSHNYSLWFYPKDTSNPVQVVRLEAEPTTLALVVSSTNLPATLQPRYFSWTDKMLTAIAPPAIFLEPNIRRESGYCGSEHRCGFGLAAIASVLGWLLARRYHFSRSATIGWVIFIFPFGIAGLLAFLCVQEWPKRELCPDCQKLRMVDRESCEYCGSAFAAPEKNGTEIFAPLTQG